MSSELRTIWRHSRIYGLGSLLNRLAGLLLIPVVLHVLPTEEWGVYALVLAVTGVIAVPAVALIDTMVRLYFENEDLRRRSRVVSTLFGLYALMAVALALLSPLLALALGALMLGHQDYYAVFVVGVLLMVFDLLMGLVLDYLRILKRSGLFVVATLSRSLLQFALSVLLVVTVGMGVMGVVLGSLVAAAVVSLPLAVHILTRVGLGFEPAIAREALSLGLPLVPAWLSKSSYPLIERYIVNLLVGTGGLGVFALGSRLTEQLGVLMQGPFADIWGVRLMEVAQDRTRAADFNRVFLYFLFVLTAAALALALLAPEVIMVISDRGYWSAAALVPLLALAQIAVAVNYHFELCLIQTRHTGDLAVINGAVLVVAGLLLIGLTAGFGLIGAAFGTLAAQVCRLAAAAWATARRSRYVALFPWGACAGVVALAAGAFAGAAVTVGPEVSLPAFLVKAAAFALFVAAVYLSPVLSPDERRAIRGYVRARLAGLGRGVAP